MSVGITVLLPIFWPNANERAQFLLDRAITSVLEQQCDVPLEILIIDDGSSPPVMQQMASARWTTDRRLRVLRFSTNHGLVNALNSGLARAHHTWIARIDADDAWVSGKLAHQVDRIRADPDLTIVGTGMHLVDDAFAITSTHIRPGKWEGVMQFTSDVGCPFPHGSILARRDVFRILGGYNHDPRFRHCEDFALWCTWLRFFKADMVELPLYLYTVSSGQISAVHADQQRTASGIVHAEFLRLKSPREIPGVLSQLAAENGVPVLQFGKRLALAWRYFDFISATDALVDRLRFLLPDRQVFPASEIPFCHAERVCHFGPLPSPHHAHLRRVVTANNLESASLAFALHEPHDIP